MAKKKKVLLSKLATEEGFQVPGQILTSPTPGELLLGFPLAVEVPSMCLMSLSYVKILARGSLGEVPCLLQADMILPRDGPETALIHTSLNLRETEGQASLLNQKLGSSYP